MFFFGRFAGGAKRFIGFHPFLGSVPHAEFRTQPKRLAIRVGGPWAPILYREGI
jgi:hypothetical protein